MGITIDEAENYLIALKHCETCEASDINICKTCTYYRRGNSAKCYDAVDVAIETMRKYQKIKEIMSELNGNFYGSYLKDRQALEKIYEVI